MPTALPSPPFACDFPWADFLTPVPTRIRLAELLEAVPAKYQLLGSLGSGAFGAVLLVRDRLLDRPVALKILSSTCPVDQAHFHREARLMARLNHPGVVRIFEMDRVAGRTYSAMEYLDGGHLGRVRLAPGELVRSLRPVVDALAHAHTLGIVHRDIKPENILLDHALRGHLSDFGLARDGREPEARVEGLLGTPRTMSPEQARGDAGALDARSDVFSLGVTLYHALTGSWPFDAPDIGALLDAIASTEPAPLRRHDPRIPGELESLVLRCLEKEREARFQSMSELGVELDRLLAKRPEREHDDRTRGWRGLVRRLVNPPTEDLR